MGRLRERRRETERRNKQKGGERQRHDTVLTHVDLFIAAVNKYVPILGSVGSKHVQLS